MCWHILLTNPKNDHNNPPTDHGCYRQKRGRAALAAAGAATSSVVDEEDRVDEDEGDEEAALNLEKPAAKVNKPANVGKKSLGTDKWRA